MRKPGAPLPDAGPERARIAAIAVSQATSLEVLGIDGRRYLAHLRDHPEIPRRHIGRLIVSAVADWVPQSKPTNPDQPRREWSATAAIAKAVR